MLDVVEAQVQLRFSLASFAPVGALAVAGLFGCSGPQGATHRERPPTPVTVVEAKSESVPVDVRVIGSVVPFATVAVQPRVAGQLVAVDFKEGETVKKGATLFQIDPAPYAAALAQAEAVLARDQVQADNADAESARYTQLVAQKLVSPSEAEAKQAAAKALHASLAADKAAVDTARLNLSWTRVTAPVTGRADKRQVDVGNLVQPGGTAVVVLRQIAPIQVQFALQQDLLLDVQERMKQGTLDVTAQIPNHAGAVEKGALSFIGSAIDASTGTVTCKADFDNADQHLWPGAYVNVVLTLGSRDNAVVVPASTVQTSQQGPFAFVVKSDGTAEMRQVVPGPQHGSEIVIDSGVKPGEKVVVDGQLSLVPGAHVVEKAPVEGPTK